MRRFGALVLALASLALVGVIWLEWRRPEIRSVGRPVIVPRLIAHGGTPGLAASAAAGPPMEGDRLGTALTRPMFASSRRPTASRATAQAAPPQALPRLAGIIMIGGQRTAIFAPGGDRRPITVAEGGVVEGFRVEAIEAGSVTVSGQGGRQVLRPRFDASAPPPVVAAPAPPSTPAAAAYNGPPGLSAMPQPSNNPQPPPASNGDLPGLPGVPGLSLDGAAGIPGLPTGSIPGLGAERVQR